MRKILIFFLLLFMLIPVFAEKYEKFYPLFKDIPGWKGNKPGGTDISYGNNQMVMSTREYYKGEKNVTVNVVVGIQAMTYWQALKMANTKVSSSNGEYLEVKDMNGFRVLLQRENEHCSLVIFLSKENLNKGGVLVFDGTKISLDELLNFAKKFDWKGFKKVYSSLFK